ncbi:Flavin-nucleotide-binding protein [Candidatus Terasakiella magnetica]|nr:Flavin-nucleotide-binding protein [Candidatus Terasakiella magnetica]
MLIRTPRSTPRAKPDRVVYDRTAAYAILDEALVCHVGIVVDGMPIVMPTTHWRMKDRLYFHGGQASRLAKVMASGAPLSVTVTLVDGVVLARSAVRHSMNYRSVILFGAAREVSDQQVKADAFVALIEKLVPGRAAHVRPTTAKELAATKLLEFEIGEGSVKARSGPPAELERDLSWPVWAGVAPVVTRRGIPEPDTHWVAGTIAGKPE